MWDILIGHSFELLLKGNVRCSCGGYLRNILVVLVRGIFLYDAFMGHSWDILVRQSCRTLLRGILAEYFYRIVLWDITLFFFDGIYVCLSFFWDGYIYIILHYLLFMDVLGYVTIDYKLWLIVSLLFVYLIYFIVLPHKREIENYFI